MRGTYLRVGLLALLAGGLVLGIVLFLASSGVRHGQGFETYFRDSVQGLDVGAPVKYRGVAVGQVTAIGLVNAEYGAGPSRLSQDPIFRQVLTRFEIDTARIGAMPDPSSLAREGLRARIAPQGLTGQSYLELEFLDGARFPAFDVPWTPRNPYIPSAQSTLSQVTDSATILLAKIAKIDIGGLADGLQGLVADLHAMIHSGGSQTLMTELVETVHLARAGLAAAEIPAITAELRETLTALRGLAQGPQTRDLLRAATQTSERLTQATARLPPLLVALEDVVRRADGVSADAEAGLAPILRDARAAVAALRETSEALRQDPGAIILQAAPPRQLAR